MLSQATINDEYQADRYKVLHDPIHKYISLQDEILQIIDTPQYQRLRDLKQLGTVSFVYAGATHNRFEHSIGVSYLSGAMIDHLASSQPDLDISAEERLWVRAAGAVHDLGHGPFSHVFDGLFLPSARPGVKWSHEDMSLDLLDLLLDENGVEALDFGGGRNAVKHMVMGNKWKGPKPAAAAGAGIGGAAGGAGGLTLGHNGVGHFSSSSSSAAAALATSLAVHAGAGGALSRSSSSGGVAGAGAAFDLARAEADRPFLYEIVANGHCGIDTDRFDYLARDSYFTGVQSAFDYRRLLYGARVMGDGHIGFHAKDAGTVYELFHTRHQLFRQIYVHR